MPSPDSNREEDDAYDYYDGEPEEYEPEDDDDFIEDFWKRQNW